jgi:hypothetical protein
MTTQKQISQLSFAAITLLLAALPAFAQTGSADNQIARSNSAAVEAEQIATITKSLPSVATPEMTNIVAPASSERLPNLSAAQFTNAASQPLTINNTAKFELSSETSKSFSNETSSHKSVTFVPSRTPKFPW